MFWGLVLHGRKEVREWTVKRSLHVSMASLSREKHGDVPGSLDVTVHVTYDGEDYQLCRFFGSTCNIPLDLNFEEGKTLFFRFEDYGVSILPSYSVRHVDLTGYYTNK